MCLGQSSFASEGAKVLLISSDSPELKTFTNCRHLYFINFRYFHFSHIKRDALRSNNLAGFQYNVCN